MATKTQTKKVHCGICRDWEIKNPERCSNTLIHKRKRLYFCTRKCKERFMKSPEKFL